MEEGHSERRRESMDETVDTESLDREMV